MLVEKICDAVKYIRLQVSPCDHLNKTLPGPTAQYFFLFRILKILRSIFVYIETKTAHSNDRIHPAKIYTKTTCITPNRVFPHIAKHTPAMSVHSIPSIQTYTIKFSSHSKRRRHHFLTIGN